MSDIEVHVASMSTVSLLFNALRASWWQHLIHFERERHDILRCQGRGVNEKGSCLSKCHFIVGLFVSELYRYVGVRAMG